MNFLAELLLRLFGETPAFFKVVRLVGLITAGIGALPTFLEKAGYALPEAYNNIVFQAVAIAGAVTAFISQLTLTPEAKKDLKVK
jgi:hypothetical protein